MCPKLGPSGFGDLEMLANSFRAFTLFVALISLRSLLRVVFIASSVAVEDAVVEDVALGFWDDDK